MQIKNLHVAVSGKPILNGVCLDIKPGEIHVVMGPNGSGKSTLANSIMGHPKYSVTEGEITINKKNIVKLSPDKRAHAGVFLAFQYPKEIPGVSVSSFIQTAMRETRNQENKKTRNPIQFRKTLRANLVELGLDAKFMNRDINHGFSGGEKKKMEVLQMTMLKPKFAILDEPDSGLDIDALKIVAEAINQAAKAKLGILLITHYQRILKYIKPTKVHVMMCGKIVKSGGPELVRKLEREGYKEIKFQEPRTKYQ
jgi:Fe-S cluster assembly ATP-binding protein